MFKLIVLLYYCYCFGYGFHTIRKKKENGLIKVLIVTFFPLFGMILTVYLFPKKPIQIHQINNVNNEGKKKVADVKQFRSVHVENEINFVPIQDALILNDNKTKRKLIIHSLKENSIQNPDILRQALQNEDSETSHYAATAIMEMKRKLLNSIREYSVMLDEKPNDVEVLTSYAEVIKEYLRSGFLDRGTYQRYQSLLSSVLEKILESQKINKDHFIDKILCELELMNHRKASYYSELFLEEYPEDEMAYIMAMKLQYTLQNPIALQQIINELKKQPVHLSAKGLSIIRYWT